MIINELFAIVNIKNTEENLLADGECHDPLVLYGEYLIDGFLRYELCLKYSIKFRVTQMDFGSIDDAKIWIIENALARRNLSDAMKIELARKKIALLKEKAKMNLSLRGKNEWLQRP